MMHLLLFLFALSSAVGQINDDQLMRILRGLHSDIHDVEFVCEGSVTKMNVGPEGSSGTRDEIRNRFQAWYAYREDGAEYLDLYQRPTGSESEFLHRTVAQLKGKLEDRIEYPDLKESPPVARLENTSTGSCTFNGSPERYLKLWYWKKLSYSTASIELTYEGLENIDGNPVVRLLIDEYPKNHVPFKKWTRYWVDLGRNGHVVKQERYWGADLVFRMHNVVLTQFTDERKRQVWFPTHAEFDTFATGGKFRATPVFHETYDVVRGSLVLNRDLPDSRFSLKWKRPRTGPEGFIKASKEFQGVPAKRRPEPLPSDPSSVQRYQEEKLAEADRQAAQLNASPPEQGYFTREALAPWGLALLSIMVLGGAITAKYRGWLA